MLAPRIETIINLARLGIGGAKCKKSSRLESMTIELKNAVLISPRIADNFIFSMRWVIKSFIELMIMAITSWASAAPRIPYWLTAHHRTVKSKIVLGMVVLVTISGLPIAL